MPYSISKNAKGCDGIAVVKEGGKVVGCHDSMEKAQKHLAALKANVEDAMLTVIDEKLYATAKAFIVESPEDLPREMASAFPNKDALNPSFLWVAGRYVQANEPNRNGQYWTYDDLQAGEQTIRYTPLNVLHKFDRPVGTLVETKIVHRESASEDRLLPEIQALGVVWAANFPNVAEQVKTAHQFGQLWYSMECVAEAKQCLTCENVFPFRAQSHEVCDHMRESALSPRRFINPTFLGGALIFPPERPGWKDADITEVAKALTAQFAHRADSDADVWERLMTDVVAFGK